MADRRCENCGGAVPPRTSRQRNNNGSLVCDSCISLNLPKWSAAMSYAAAMGEGAEMKRRMVESIASIARVRRARTAGLRIVAHDSGDNAIINHCPFCGSGGVVAKGEGTVSCEFCHSNFTVQVQPAHPFMPQTVDGQPVPPAGMPGDQPTEMSAPLDPAVNETEEGVVDDENVEPDVDPADPTGQEPPGNQPKGPKRPVPPQFAKGGSTTAAQVTQQDKDLAQVAKTMTGREFIAYQHKGKGCDCPRSMPMCRWGRFWDRAMAGEYDGEVKTAYRTDEGHTLDESAYMARLALSHADDRDAVLDVVRYRHTAAQQPTVDCRSCKGEGTTPGTDEACEVCDGTGLVEVKIPKQADLLNPDSGIDVNDRDLLARSGLDDEWDEDLLAPPAVPTPRRMVPPWLRDEQTGGFYS